MCDYSLGGLPNRLAAEGDELVVHRFPASSIGLAPAAHPRAKGSAPWRYQNLWRRSKALLSLPRFCPNIQAVCVPPGASLLLKSVPRDLQRKWDIAEEEIVLFTQTSAEFKTHRDAICFRNGRQVSLQHLREGLFVKVVSLGGDAAADRQPEAVQVGME